MPLSDPILAILVHCQPWCTAPTWKNVMTRLTGTIVARGRRTVTAAVSQTGHHLESIVSTFPHVLHRARWSPLAVSRQVLTRLVETVVHAGGSLDVVIDETRERRWGATIGTRGHDRESALSSRTRSVRSPGLRWIVMAAVVTLPWTEASVGRAVCVRSGNHTGREREAGNASHDGGHAGPSDGEPAASVASHHASHAHRRHGREHLRQGVIGSR